MHHHIKRCTLIAIFACAAHVVAQPSFSIDSVGPFDAYQLHIRIPGRTLYNQSHSMSFYLGTQQVDDVRDAWVNLVDQSVRDEVIALEAGDATASSNLAFLGFFANGKTNTSTFQNTTDRLATLGVSPNTRSAMMDALDEEVGRANQVIAHCSIDNINYDESPSGKIILYRMTGRVRTQANTERSFRVLSSGGQFAPGVSGESSRNVFCTYESTGFVDPPSTSQTSQTTQTTSTDATNPGGTSATGQPLIDGTGDPSGSVRHGASSYVAVVAAFTSLALAAWSADYR